VRKVLIGTNIFYFDWLIRRIIVHILLCELMGCAPSNDVAVAPEEVPPVPRVVEMEEKTASYFASSRKSILERPTFMQAAFCSLSSDGTSTSIAFGQVLHTCMYSS
jgi:hypothetical protein